MAKTSGEPPQDEKSGPQVPAAEDREVVPDPKTVTVDIIPDDDVLAEAVVVTETSEQDSDGDSAAEAEDEVVVDPVTGVTELTTTSVELDPEAAAGDVEFPNDVVPLPETGTVFSRRSRIEGTASGHPEPAAMLTADRLLEPSMRKKPAPAGWWPNLVFHATFGLVNLGDSASARYQKDVLFRISQPLEGGTKFVPVLTRKGGVGKTTITTLLGMSLASVRQDRIIAIDANPDRGTLSERVPKQTRMTVRDVVTRAASVKGFTDLSSFVSRDVTRLDVLASDTDPLMSEAFNADDYNTVADLVSRHYSIVLTDCGTGIVHSVMGATLDRADELVIVSGGSLDEARLASETLTWLESNGYAALVKNAVVAINTATQATDLVRIDEIESHFQSRVRAVLRIPYDRILAAGGIVKYSELHRSTRDAGKELAALVVDGLVSE